jgi:hypothetical protein
MKIPRKLAFEIARYAMNETWLIGSTVHGIAQWIESLDIPDPPVATGKLTEEQIADAVRLVSDENEQDSLRLRLHRFTFGLPPYMMRVDDDLDDEDDEDDEA